MDGTGGRDDFSGFSDSFPRAFARARNPSSSFFGGRGPFDDPFFTDPFITFPFRNIMGPSIFENNIFGRLRNTFGEGDNFGFLEDRPLQRHRPSGPIIEEMSDEVEDNDENFKEHEEKPKEIHRSCNGKELYVQNPIEKLEGVNEHQQYQNELRIASGREPQTSKYTFHSSTVRYGGINGTYYTSSTTRRMGSDGVVVEESKEADACSGKATHRVSRGIHDKGHSFTRKLNPDGRVNTLQTLHNLNEDELPHFEAAWKGNAGETLMGWNPGMDMHGYESTRVSNNSRSGRSSKVIDIEFLPST